MMAAMITPNSSPMVSPNRTELIQHFRAGQIMQHDERVVGLEIRVPRQETEARAVLVEGRPKDDAFREIVPEGGFPGSLE